MILIMYVQTYATIRSVFSKASDLPITLERLNSTTYVYVTMKKQPGNQPSYWMFNFLYFTSKVSKLAVAHTSCAFRSGEKLSVDSASR